MTKDGRSLSGCNENQHGLGDCFSIVNGIIGTDEGTWSNLNYIPAVAVESQLLFVQMNTGLEHSGQGIKVLDGKRMMRLLVDSDDDCLDGSYELAGMATEDNCRLPPSKDEPVLA